MNCSCGVSYSDDPSQWRVVKTRLIEDQLTPYVYAVFVATCPDCRQLGIKMLVYGTYQEPEPRQLLTSENVEHAHSVYPYITHPTRKQIDLGGVPEATSTLYRDALRALDDERLYPYAGVLARDSIEEILRDKGYKGHNLGELLDTLLSNDDNGLPRNILDYIDVIRNLGNAGAHSNGISLSKDRVEWGVEIWERVMRHYYVEPARDEAYRTKLNDDLLAAGKPPVKIPNNQSSIT